MQLSSSTDRTPGGLSSSSVVITYWPIAVLLSALPALRAIALFWHTGRARRGVCPDCGYDLRATPDRCPECGRAS
jgi:hypothetical protein